MNWLRLGLCSKLKATENILQKYGENRQKQPIDDLLSTSI